MKMFNKVCAPFAGRIVEVLMHDSGAVVRTESYRWGDLIGATSVARPASASVPSLSGHAPAPVRPGA